MKQKMTTSLAALILTLAVAALPHHAAAGTTNAPPPPPPPADTHILKMLDLSSPRQEVSSEIARNRCWLARTHSLLTSHLSVSRRHLSR